MAEGGPQKSLTEMVEQINANPDYKVLTKAEYESLLALASHKPKASGDKEVPVTSTPQANQTVDLGTKPKFTFPNPGVSPVPRLQQILNASRPFNSTYAAQSYKVPKLPFLVGRRSPRKGKQLMKCGILKLNVFKMHTFMMSILSFNLCGILLKGQQEQCLFLLGRMQRLKIF